MKEKRKQKEQQQKKNESNEKKNSIKIHEAPSFNWLNKILFFFFLVILSLAIEPRITWQSLAVASHKERCSRL